MQQGLLCIARSAAGFRRKFTQGPVYAFARQSTVAVSSPEQENPPVALVQGASRGLGLEYVKQLLGRPGQR